jgi:hypothetical protein
MRGSASSCFDGVVLEGMEEAYRFFEYGEKEQETTKKPIKIKSYIPNPTPSTPGQ